VQTLSVLFTDVVGSTEIAMRLGDDASDSLRREHFRALRDAVESTGGQVVKTIGDGVMARFSSVRRALDGAAAIQRTVDTTNRDARHRLDVRVGVSVGDVTVEQGDCFGMPVVEAARLCSAADHGRILAIERVRELAAGSGHVFSVGREVSCKSMTLRAVEIEWASDAAVTPIRHDLFTRNGSENEEEHA